MRSKAERLGIADKVLSINSFISKASADYPALVEYKALNVKKEQMGNIDVKNPFFDTFRPAYKTSFENLHFKSERDCDFLFMHGHDFSIIPSWKNVILSRRAPPKQVILQIQNTRRYSYETER